MGSKPGGGGGGTLPLGHTEEYSPRSSVMTQSKNFGGILGPNLRIWMWLLTSGNTKQQRQFFFFFFIHIKILQHILHSTKLP